VMAFYDIENLNLISLKEIVANTRMIRILLKGQALSNLEHHLRKRLEAEESELNNDTIIDLVLRYIVLE
jgi:hypothetical protein